MAKKLRLGGNSRRLKRLVTAAEDNGYQVSTTSNNHLMLIPPISGFSPLLFRAE